MVFDNYNKTYSEWYNDLLSYINLLEERNKIKNSLLTPNELEEILEEIIQNIKDGDLIDFIHIIWDPTLYYVAKYGNDFLLGYMNISNGYMLPGSAISYLSGNNLGTLDKIKREYGGLNISKIKVPEDPTFLENWIEKDYDSYFLKNEDNYDQKIKYGNFTLYLGKSSSGEEYYQNDDD